MYLLYHKIIILDYKKVYNYRYSHNYSYYILYADTQSQCSEVVVHKIFCSHTKGSMF